jgi:hypothetical protein
MGRIHRFMPPRPHLVRLEIKGGEMTTIPVVIYKVNWTGAWSVVCAGIVSWVAPGGAEQDRVSSEWVLICHGFHWVHEFPFNR